MTLRWFYQSGRSIVNLTAKLFNKVNWSVKRYPSDLKFELKLQFKGPYLHSNDRSFGYMDTCFFKRPPTFKDPFTLVSLSMFDHFWLRSTINFQTEYFRSSFLPCTLRTGHFHNKTNFTGQFYFI